MKVTISDGKIYAQLKDLRLWDKNPRSITEKDFRRLKFQILKLGQYKPSLVTPEGLIVGGNMRFRAYGLLKEEIGASGVEKVAKTYKVPSKRVTEFFNQITQRGIWVSVIKPKDDNELMEYALSDNDRAGYYDADMLANISPEFDLDWENYAVDLNEPIDLSQLVGRGEGNGEDGDSSSLAEEFIIPPFSVFDTRQGYWQARKDEWIDRMGGREALAESKEDVLSDGKNNNIMSSINDGSSIFDPVLAEIIYKWFNVENGKILDPFAGEQTKGFVAGALGYKYTGIELRQEQVDLDKEAVSDFNDITYITGDSAKVLPKIKDRDFDLVFTSPPYYDLEVYSDKKDDGSAMGTYAEFMAFYKEVFAESVARLKDNRFLVVKVGEIRDRKTGVYRQFVADNIRLFTELGLSFYNDIVLVTMIGTASIRARNAMANRKIAKTHQNILVFYKGNTKDIQKHFNPLDFSGVEGVDEPEN